MADMLGKRIVQRAPGCGQRGLFGEADDVGFLWVQRFGELLMAYYRIKPKGRYVHPCRFGCGRYIRIKRSPCYACIVALLTGGKAGPVTLDAERAEARAERKAKSVAASVISLAGQFAFCTGL